MSNLSRRDFVLGTAAAATLAGVHLSLGPVLSWAAQPTRIFSDKLRQDAIKAFPNMPPEQIKLIINYFEKKGIKAYPPPPPLPDQSKPTTCDGYFGAALKWHAGIVGVQTDPAGNFVRFSPGGYQGKPEFAGFLVLKDPSEQGEFNNSVALLDPGFGSTNPIISRLAVLDRLNQGCKLDGIRPSGIQPVISNKLRPYFDKIKLAANVAGASQAKRADFIWNTVIDGQLGRLKKLGIAWFVDYQRPAWADPLAVIQLDDAKLMSIGSFRHSVLGPNTNNPAVLASTIEYVIDNIQKRGLPTAKISTVPATFADVEKEINAATLAPGLDKHAWKLRIGYRVLYQHLPKSWND